mmetsp:Transcript_104269/g.207089  ORF Transcript_104269/g.207089 Transcript_104269/m.207089 type:complete len:286 (+) Transcript_104269:299-1156(+)
MGKRLLGSVSISHQGQRGHHGPAAAAGIAAAACNNWLSVHIHAAGAILFGSWRRRRRGCTTILLLLLWRNSLICFLICCFGHFFLLLLWLWRWGWPGLPQNFVCHFRKLLVLFLHIRTDERWLFMGGHGLLFGLHVVQPFVQLCASGSNLSKLLASNVPILVPWIFGSCAIISDCAMDCIYPIRTHPRFLETPDHRISCALQLFDLLDVLGLCRVWIVVQPILGRSQSLAESFSVSSRNEGAIFAMLTNLVAHIENVAFKVVAPLISLENITHICLHGELLVHTL